MRAARRGASTLARRWAPRSRLLLVGDRADWSIAHDLRELARIAGSLGVRTADERFLNVSSGQAAFFGSQFDLLRRDVELPAHSVATAYFHGRPGTEGMLEFDECYEALRRLHHGIARVQVTHAEMRDLVLSAGVDPVKVHTIRIGVDADAFRLRSAAEKASARSALGIPASAFVVGSFQKDGVGWDEGLEPKLVKGPDVLLAALERVHMQTPELFVVLTGPARGYVRAGLEQRGIPYVHRFVRRQRDLRPMYLPLDVVAVASRQEGGPKAVLEAMAVGVPVASTRVGQAQELIDGRNGLLVDVADADALGDAIVRAAGGGDAFTARGRATAEANAYAAQAPLWSAFFEGFVRVRGPGAAG